MDHWGDPWADNANDKSPTKNAVTSPLPPAFTFAPVPLGGFVDDAGWGNNEEDGFGDWATSDTGKAASIDVVSTPAGGVDPGSADWGTVTPDEREDINPKWPEPATDAPQIVEMVDSEPSDSSTVSQSDEVANQDTIEEHVQPQIDLESSVRSSTSPSETSRNDLPVESPRTSVEDERTIHKAVSPSEPLAIAEEAHTTVADSSPDLGTALTTKPTLEKGEEDVDDSTAFKDLDEQAAGADELDDASLDVSDNQKDGEITPERAAAVNTSQPRALPKPFVCDTVLLAQLFPCAEQTDKQLDEHDDPIFSTSARKAWYRVTRKQTMREFNHGDNDDNYIRVTWTNSNVRAEVHKVVSRWAREDRISGTGPGARASFYWDTPAPAESQAPFGHSRTQSSVPTTKTALPARQSLPPLASNQSAAFNWSSSASTDPWKLESPSQRSTSSPLAPKNPVVAKLQRQEGRAVSLDLTPRKSEQAMHKRTATVSHAAPEIETAASLIAPPISQPSQTVRSLAELDKFDSIPISTVEPTDPPVDDDDDWGEMVQTPTLATPQQLDPFSKPQEPKNILPPPSLPSSNPTFTAGSEIGPVEPMFAAPIVRLQSTVSPTSALFKANTFVPLNVEQGPIGPGILKPANRSARSVSDKKLGVVVPGEVSAESSGWATASPTDDKNGNNFEASRTKPNLVSLPDALELDGHVVSEASPTPAAHPATPTQVPEDAWADADFSFFESTLPASALQSTSQTHDPSDPFSFFDTPAPASIPPSSKSFSRSPPRVPTSPTLQPLSGATSSVQRRKAEEDQKINDILNGLPNLGYMLRQ
ncbi:hypothetical protein SVAN01_01029 [Stagonosporopsis vannaccii]|nr:hypothetical protein SVAN01_01029 [Stagonosporopsis vannaccii]